MVPLGRRKVLSHWGGTKGSLWQASTLEPLNVILSRECHLFPVGSRVLPLATGGVSVFSHRHGIPTRAANEGQRLGVTDAPSPHGFAHSWGGPPPVCIACWCRVIVRDLPGANR